MPKYTINVDFDIVAQNEEEAAKELAKRLENAFFSIADCRIIEVNNFEDRKIPRGYCKEPDCDGH